MRASFTERLDEVRGQMVTMAATATSAIRWASDSLLGSDLDDAGRALAAAGRITEARRDVDVRVHDLMALQQPVAGDLRLALASLRVAGEIERMGALAAHIAKIMLRRHPVETLPAQIAPVFRTMADVAERLAWKVTRLLEVAEVRLAWELDRDDDAMDDLHRRMFEVLLGDWPHSLESAVDAALLARFYERYADHAVNAGRHVVFLITGRHPAAGEVPR